VVMVGKGREGKDNKEADKLVRLLKHMKLPVFIKLTMSLFVFLYQQTQID
jgi:hypothetical protein